VHGGPQPSEMFFTSRAARASRVVLCNCVCFFFDCCCCFYPACFTSSSLNRTDRALPRARVLMSYRASETTLYYVTDGPCEKETSHLGACSGFQRWCHGPFVGPRGHHYGAACGLDISAVLHQV